MLVDIANASVNDGYQVSVCITRSRTDLAHELDARIYQIVLNRKRRFDLAAMRRFRSVIADRQVEIIHAHGRSTLSFVVFSGLLYSHRARILLHDHHGGIEIDLSVPLWFRILGNKVLSAYIGVYKKLGNWAIESGILRSRVFVIGNGLNLRRIELAQPIDVKNEFGIHDQTLVGLFVAGLRREKGLDLLIESLAMLSGTLPNFKILIVGGERDPIYVHECKALAKKKGVSDLLILAGERADVPRIIRSVDFALIPSRSESGPLVLIEYMAAQLPFVSFRVGDIAQHVAQCNIPGTVDPNNIIDFAKEVSVLLSQDSVSRAERGRLGREIVERSFSIEVKMPQFYRVYDDIRSVR